ncbi:hypothetical protein TNCV_3397081 [Trichonephila clavipes]|nr:hypothetical protein TNCV_3397081 [Trichonephila clavipes]
MSFQSLQCPESFFQNTTVSKFLHFGQKLVVFSYVPDYPFLSSAILYSCLSQNLLGRALVDDLCQLKHSKVSVLPYNSLETTLIMFLENCDRTALTSSRERI